MALGQEPLAGPVKTVIYQLGPEKIRDELFNLGLSFLNTQPRPMYVDRYGYGIPCYGGYMVEDMVTVGISMGVV